MSVKKTTLQELEQLDEELFQEFFHWLPARVKLTVKAGVVDWKLTLPEWYEIYKRLKKDGS